MMNTFKPKNSISKITSARISRKNHSKSRRTPQKLTNLFKKLNFFTQIQNHSTAFFSLFDLNLIFNGLILMCLTRENSEIFFFYLRKYLADPQNPIPSKIKKLQILDYALKINNEQLVEDFMASSLFISLRKITKSAFNNKFEKKVIEAFKASTVEKVKHLVQFVDNLIDYAEEWAELYPNDFEYDEEPSKLSMWFKETWLGLKTKMGEEEGGEGDGVVDEDPDDNEIEYSEIDCEIDEYVNGLQYFNRSFEVRKLKKAQKLTNSDFVFKADWLL